MSDIIWVDIDFDEYDEEVRELESRIHEAVGDDHEVWTSPSTMHTLSMDEYRGLRGAVQNMSKGDDE